MLFLSQVWPGPQNESQAHNVTCQKHLLTSYLIPDLLLMVAYVYGLYVFRMALPEHLTTLMETVREEYMYSTIRFVDS